ncbi:hypothetical protein [Clostridium sp.]|jgi:hypothetical protein|uniref:hypothetical protein n=1 Tax=Clostridium sp. TaxID=1506 RepID=UPI00258C4047|nr:hypothetical protein [Clostridium sp.]
MKKVILYCLCCAIIVVIAQIFFRSYCLNNVILGVTAGANEQTYPEYVDKIMGFGGVIKNNTMFPIKVKSVEPLDGSGVEYVTTAITKWGVSEISEEELLKKESLESKILEPFSEYSIGYFYKLTGEYMVNPDEYEITYSVLGIKFSKIEIFN